MKTSSAKDKGRRLQKHIRDLIIKYFNLSDKDVLSTSMGASGSDVKLSERAFKMFPYDIECKNVERLNVWEAYDQSAARCTADSKPLLFIKKNRRNALVVLDAELFIKLHSELTKGD